MQFDGIEAIDMASSSSAFLSLSPPSSPTFEWKVAPLLCPPHRTFTESLLEQGESA